MKKLDLNTLQKYIQVRPITLNDYEQIYELALKCFPGMQPWGKEQIASQLETFPQGQLCVEYQGRIIGSSSSLIIDFDEYGEKHSWQDISDGGYISNHDPEGDTLYGIEVMVDPEFRGMKIGRRLYHARKDLVHKLNLKRIVIGGRVPNYHKYADKMDIYEYVDRVQAKEFYDPVLTFQLANGFYLKRIITDYMQSDAESQGFALLLEWVNWHYDPKPTHRTLFSFPVRICSVQYNLRKINSFDDFAQQCEYFVDIASGYKSDFAVFPEIFTLQLLSFLPRERPGKAVRTLASFTSQYIDLFQKLAINYNVNIIGGSHYTEENGDIYNIAYLFKRDGSIDKQYKLHITPNERRWWGVKAGDSLQVFETDRGKISIQICYDIEFPELGRMATQKGAQIIFVPFCTDERHGYLRVRYCAQARAIENQTFVATAGCVGNLPFVDNIDINYAQSAIFTPSDFPFSREGIAAECQANIETVVIADVDLDLLKRNRLDGTVRNWIDRRKDIYDVIEKNNRHLINLKASIMAPKNRFPLSKLSPTTNDFQGSDIESLMLSFVNHLEYSFAKDENSATMLDFYKSLALTTRDRLIERWVETQHTYYKKDVKRVYYLSMEYLTGRLMHNALINLGLEENMREALAELGLELDELEAIEPDAGLGNGGLGRLAACFLDSMATLKLPCYGYGIRYEYGIFAQKIINGEQVEFPDGWLHFGNPWEIEHPDYYFQIQFYGHVNQYTDESGKLISEWLETDDVRAIAYDTPVPGHRNNTVNHLRLWAAKSSKAFDLTYFNHGDYEKAVEHKVESETISRVLYPNDEKMRGRELRLKQEYFFVSATLQDIVRRHKLRHNDFDNFPDKVAIQLNDTHPAVAIAELMRLFLDIENLDWDKAWSICTCVFAYTNHTILPEALEKWRVTLFGQLLPRHLQIVYEINRRFIEQIRQRFPGDEDRVRRMSIIEEGPEKRIRMAYLAIVGSHKVNGVAALHSQIIRETLFKDFAELWPEKFTNKTNGISQRRWLQACNPRLAELITSTIGDDGWLLDLYKLKSLASLADDSRFQKKWQKVKRANKQALADFIFEKYSVRVNVDSIFDCQIKRIHEYKRQLLNILHAITLYNRIKAQPEKKFTPRTILFAGKAAPGYKMAKLIIKLINDVAEVINGDPDVGDRLKVLFLEDYSVSLAEKMIPAADLSEQISTAGMEASGTGNMKFALNGAITIGTLDGANIEILQEVGEENIFIFGLKADEIMTMRAEGYNPWDYYNSNPELKKALDMISNGHFSSEEPERFRAIIDSLLHQGDYYMLLAGYENYIACQEKVNEAFDDQRRWAKMSILNVANMGVFSSDRTIQEYAEDIWDVSPTEIQIPAGSAPKSWKSTLHHLFKAKE